MRVRQSFRVTGLVQGVGFRPTVWRLARALELAGEVYNDARGVVATVEGPEEAVAAFPERLREEVAREAPLARVDGVVSLGFEPVTGGAEFVISPSRGGAARTTVTPDAATCPACLADLTDPGDRRYRYAFTNCTHCGPRHTITRHIPYDRARTSMAGFVMCPDCQREYDSPADRRFHAQPNACPRCGPRLWLTDPAGRELTGDPIAEALTLLRAGRVVAIKGLGGFHLACDATSEAAVARLRRRKGREEKALAVMVANLPSAERLADFTPAGRAALTAPARPIVLAPKTAAAEELLAPSVAPGYRELGLMLPYTPLHWLLFHEYLGRPAGSDRLTDEVIPLALVMTSANPGGEPLVTGNDESYARLGGIADAFLTHDRDIVVRCDDSVTRDFASGTRMVRRARGYTPLALPFPAGAPSVLALGPMLKCTACLTRGAEAFVTEHIGDTDDPATARALERSARHFMDILETRPRALACDLHPDFASTRLAERLAAEWELPLYPVQHHHAHIAAVAGEHRLDEPVWGLAMDGVGLGPDQVAWGGELLRLTPDGRFERRGHLRPMPLPGHDRAAREPRRMGAALCLMAGRPELIDEFWPAFRGQPMVQLMENPRLCGRTTALGRLFDAASAILGLVETMHDEAWAATRLESVASARAGHALTDGWRIGADGELDLMPLMAWLIQGRLEGRPADQAAADFEETVCAALAAWASQLIPPGSGPVCLAGGCFLNRCLADGLPRRLSELGHQVLLPSRLPPGDGAISYGQAIVTAARLAAPGE